MIKTKFKFLVRFYKHNNKLFHEFLHLDFITLDFYLTNPESYIIIENVFNNLKSCEIYKLIDNVNAKDIKDEIVVEYIGDLNYYEHVDFNGNFQNSYEFKNIRFMVDKDGL